jgi:hypothetical protein
MGTGNPVEVLKRGLKVLFDAVMECRNAREDEPITGSDDVDDTSP